MGIFNKIKASKVEKIHLNEKENSKYKVKQFIDYDDAYRKKGTWKEERELVIGEEGISIYDVKTAEITTTLHWREMKWFEVRPATKEWVIDLREGSKSERIRFSGSKVTKIHDEAQEFLNRYIRNLKLSLYKAQPNDDNSAVHELMAEANTPVAHNADDDSKVTVKVSDFGVNSPSDAQRRMRSVTY
eukprot:TRINITY_DN2044_c0_g1_i1.p1 TRINITY_DN2044_c0_g1~~TRINITY_DN2044_c0_g1_i1.p1  ORF type:complete len:207 (-),score=72.15 TRINITY_DN2044_c0_g1_i1:8-568(-)